ncbi:hypothetical protein GCM10009533_10770 [Saccharopolyspora spinosporotrichia]|uniref:Uncharacterized protein n=1 Tax=Saccharopolyspora erythraea TaxID=1836 RepID=A0ABN1C9W6_SACER
MPSAPVWSGARSTMRARAVRPSPAASATTKLTRTATATIASELRRYRHNAPKIVGPGPVSSIGVNSALCHEEAPGESALRW